MRTSPLAASLALLPLLGCPHYEEPEGTPVEGAATFTEDCAPDDGAAWSFDIGLDAATCDAGHPGSWLRITVWYGLDPMEGATWDLDPALGQGQVLYFPDPDVNEWMTATSGGLQIETWAEGDSATGNYDLWLEDGTHLAGTFDAAYCAGAPMCG